MLLICQKCGEKISQDYFSRDDICPNCGTYLRSCIQCVFYDPSSNHSCKEPVAEEVLDKEAANFCEYFMPNSEKTQNSSFKKKDDVLKELDSLFKK